MLWVSFKRSAVIKARTLPLIRMNWYRFSDEFEHEPIATSQFHSLCCERSAKMSASQVLSCLPTADTAEELPLTEYLPGWIGGLWNIRPDTGFDFRAPLIGNNAFSMLWHFTHNQLIRNTQRNYYPGHYAVSLNQSRLFYCFIVEMSSSEKAMVVNLLLPSFRVCVCMNCGPSFSLSADRERQPGVVPVVVNHFRVSTRADAGVLLHTLVVKDWLFSFLASQTTLPILIHPLSFWKLRYFQSHGRPSFQKVTKSWFL